MALNNSPAPKSSEPGYPPGYPGNYPESLTDGNIARDLQTFWFLFLGKLWLIGAIVLAGMVFTAFYIVTAPKLYKATATVEVERQDQSAINKQVAYRDAQGGLEQMTTIVGRFQSRPLFSSVLCQAGLISSNAATALSLDPATQSLDPTVQSLDLLNSPSNVAASAVPSPTGFQSTNTAITSAMNPAVAELSARNFIADLEQVREPKATPALSWRSMRLLNRSATTLARTWSRWVDATCWRSRAGSAGGATRPSNWARRRRSARVNPAACNSTARKSTSTP